MVSLVGNHMTSDVVSMQMYAIYFSQFQLHTHMYVTIHTICSLIYV